MVAPEALHLHGASLNVVLDAPWCAHNHVDATPQNTLLGPVSSAPVDTESAQASGSADVLKLLVHLKSLWRLTPTT
jgi:hypothetical protein